METRTAAAGPAASAPRTPGDEAWLSREQLGPLLVRRDGPGALRLGVQLAVLGVSGAATVRLAAAGHPAWVLALAVCAVALLAFFPTLHEAGHGTAFRSARLNEAAAWLGAAAMLQSPGFFRAFHWEHHRRTQDPERDPEIAMAPDLLGEWPRNPLVYLGLASGQMLMVGKAGWTLACALLPARVWGPRFPWVRPERRRRIAWESRAVVAGLGLGVGAGLAFVPGFGALLLAWPAAHLLLGLYLMPEHTGAPNAGSQLARTRSVDSNAALRWVMWNMPLHAEHHAYPGVPFHAVPALRRLLEPHLVLRSPGYLAFHREALRRAWRR